ncbi:FAD/NAD(P)-binding protein [Flavisphingomonas formosensis]|uniref:FAD/NAD(P)-binding protein n=1 Tax=Flavisphingomonas formosensis TaxID=861534 RepID=UPI0012F823CA|nr:FAD/NAD(P)-binding protein [Sphingomonas formosensis]
MHRSAGRAVIIGAGFSGTLLAVNLLRQGFSVGLVERSHAFGRGIAYSTSHPDLLLNVRASNMSAFPDDATHFSRWLGARDGGAPQGFASRAEYGDYLAALLEEAERSAVGRLATYRSAAVDVDIAADGTQVMLDDGTLIGADVVILAVGNLSPHDPPGIDPTMMPPGSYVKDPWAAGAGEGLSDGQAVLVMGTGLSMVDTVLMLDARGFRGRIVALSRRGLLPLAHAAEPGPQHAPLAERPRDTGAALLRSVRRRAAEIGWRAAVDELRPHTQAMWIAASRVEQARFLRHVRPWWDIHRHRLAPRIADRIAALRGAGRLEVVAGRLTGVSAHPQGGISIEWRERGSGRTGGGRFGRVVNCTGPRGDIVQAKEPLLRLLLAAGHIRPDPHGLGIDVNAAGEAIDARGRANPRLFVLGPMTRGAFWEIVAVPDIRQQSAAVAHLLSKRHHESLQQHVRPDWPVEGVAAPAGPEW